MTIDSEDGPDISRITDRYTDHSTDHTADKIHRCSVQYNISLPRSRKASWF